MVRNPLSPGLYLRRNAGKTVPLIAVIVLAVLLVAGIISLMTMEEIAEHADRLAERNRSRHRRENMEERP